MRGILLSAVLSLALGPVWAADNAALVGAEEALNKDPASAVVQATTGLSAQHVSASDATALHAIRGRARLVLEDYDAAVTDLAAAIDPSRPPKDICAAYGNLYADRGEAYLKLQRHRLAAADFEHAVECEPSNPDLLEKLGRSYFYFDRQRASDAFTAALKIKPDDPKLLEIRSHNYENMQEYDLALADYNRRIALNPKDANAYNDRATVYVSLDRNQEAVSDYGKSIELNPGNFLTYYNRAQLELILHRYKDAREDVARGKALYADPEVKAKYYKLVPLAFMKQIEAFMAQVEQALNDAPE